MARQIGSVDLAAKEAGQVKADRGVFLDPFINEKTYAVVDELEVIARPRMQGC